MNNAGGTFIGHMSLPGGENVAVVAREISFEVAAIPLASEWERVGHGLSGAPKVGQAIANCGAVPLRTTGGRTSCRPRRNQWNYAQKELLRALHAAASAIRNLS